MTKYDLLQTLEMIFPNSSDKNHNDAWFITEDEYSQDEGTFIQITFKLDDGGNCNSQLGWAVYVPTDKGLKQEYWFDNKQDALRLKNEYMDELGVKATIIQTHENKNED